MTSRLFEPLTLRGTTFPHRAWVSPMCQYSSVDGLANDWHLVHLGGFALGRAGLVLTEATAVTAEGRISPDDLGLWSDAHAEALAPAVRFVRSQGVPFGVQLAHAGRKASTYAPWRGHDSVPVGEGGWEALAPSAEAFGGYAVPREMSAEDLVRTRDAFVSAAQRALTLDVDTVELHFAHGYLMHEFLSPLSNHREDGYGGSLENRMRFPLEVIDAVRGVWPDDKPLLMRISATDWVEGGWDIESSVTFAAEAASRGVDLVDVSSAGNDPRQAVALGPGYQVPYAAQVRRGAGVPTGAVGLITEPKQAEEVVADGSADVVLMARAFLREPHWALRAAHELGADLPWPPQYLRARLT
ncbi:MAG TPA: NADH:flavin oxidoreductase/NADH oxidase [Candidatus Angelobacter sp.]|nr:NADH:flavin oxidoreductase/NADH oxidase [Candidatus Angelobacter sp.]